MIFMEVFSWWYVHGWKIFIEKIKNSLSSITDFFSMNSLVRTLFKPFRQISADTANADASLDLRFQMFIDRLISRIVGFSSRLILLVVGSIIILVGGILSLLLIIIWPFIPLLPILGIVLTVLGVTL
ncbi:hypothetical protein IJH15_02505 [Candidatus Saccharibacteria bacterium]|nr:hypothetical protein [Candidatus Saccharibacteria bacterium]